MDFSDSALNLEVGQQQYLCIENKDILQDCTSSSQVLIGNFTSCNILKCFKAIGNVNQKEAIFLRANNTLEIYDISNDKYSYMGKYQIPNAICSEITGVRMTWKNKYAVVLYIQHDKLITLEFDEEIHEFKVIAMHNFENENALKDSGKQFPIRGKLRSIHSKFFSLFGYLSDDHTFVYVEMRQAVVSENFKIKSSSGHSNLLSSNVPDQIRGLKKINEKYLNAWGQDIELYYKPARFYNLWQSQKIQAIIDIEIIPMGNQNNCYLYVLHQSNFEKTVGTITKQPITKLSIFEFAQEDKDNSDLVHLYTVDFISYYARNIIKASPKDDFCYITSNCGLYIIRQEKQRFSYIQTTGMATYLEGLNNPPTEKTMVPSESLTSVKHVIDAKKIELKFDGCTRFKGLTGRRLLIMTEKGAVYIMHLIFDQAEIDVDDVLFTKVQCDLPIIPSSIKTFEKQDQIIVLVSSYYNDQAYYILKEKLQVDEQTQRVKANEDSLSYIKQKQLMTYEMSLVDNLMTLSPIADVMVNEDVNKSDQLDFICTSGYTLRSSINFIKEGIPFDSRVLSKEISNIQRVFTIRDKKQANSYDSFVVASQLNSTYVLALVANELKILDPSQSNYELAEPTIQCFSVGVQSPQRIVQVTPSKLILLTHDAKLIRSLDISMEHQSNVSIVSSSKEHLECSDCIFILLSNGSLRCYSTIGLSLKFQKCCVKLDNQNLTITALSTTTIKNLDDYLILTFQEKAQMRIYLIDDLSNELKLIYQVRGVTEQLPFLPNLLENQRHLDLISRSVTDLSINIEGDYHISEIHKEYKYVTEVVLKQIESRIILVMTLSNGMIIAYENLMNFPDIKKEKFRFKLIEAQNLRKDLKDWGQQTFQRQKHALANDIYVDNNLIIIHDKEHQKPIMITCKKNKFYFHKFLQIQDNESIYSLAQYCQQGFTKDSCYLYVDKSNETLNILKIPNMFNPKIAPVLDNFVIRQVTFNKCIRKLTKYTDSRTKIEYLLVSSFQVVKGEYASEAPGSSLSASLSDEQKAQGVQYEMEVIPMPKHGKWRSYQSNFEMVNMILKQQFKTDEMIVCMEEVKLQLGDSPAIKNFIALSTIKIDAAMIEEGFYNSFLYLYEIEHQERRLKLSRLEQCQGIITCLGDYYGKLMTVQKTQRLRDHSIVFYQFYDQVAKFEPKFQPQSIETLGLHISFDGDHIFVGDSQRNLGVLWLRDEEYLKRDKVEALSQVIQLKYMFGNTLETKVIGVYSLRIQGPHDPLNLRRLNEVEKQLLTLITASDEGYLRLFQIREEKLLECVAQLNIQDKINKMIPLPTYTSEIKRSFLVLPKRGGILKVSSLSEQEHLGLESMMQMTSRTLPSRGSLPPIFSHIIPIVPYQEQDQIMKRLNQNSINKRALGNYYFMNYNMQRAIAERIGYSVSSLNSYFV
ncbi:UNKNOWN [Stylonychia lemnae]|uniref:Uncharacterized protein n=1 Tax=Stylonychia lemnae TaxID=5949 RepID=A0A077ZTW5_STYLE|nr:UNKNOWN [Stylonychia lemnae]|eukprot:CDW71891.1 UNKNOWN [Stylonychia lemnae]